MDTIYQERLKKLYTQLQSSEFSALAINPGPTLVYLTGLHFHLSERPTIVIFSPNDIPTIILPRLEERKIRESQIDFHAYMYEDDPNIWQDTISQSLRPLNLDAKIIGVEASRMRVLELNYLQTALKQGRFISAEAILNNLRIQKSEHEAGLIKKAVKIAQEALQNTLPKITIGVTERQIASELTAQLLRCGSDPEIPFSPIVASGPNSANPHAVPSERKIQSGDLLVIDWGAAFHGYISDITRTFAVGEYNTKVKHIAEIVNMANSAGRGKCYPNHPAKAIDEAARKVIDDAGYGEFFTHRTGHGFGMEAHEPPYITSDNPLLLQPGMVFTVEPGIYIPEIGGVRIEDDILMTHDGSETLTDLTRDLVVLG